MTELIQGNKIGFKADKQLVYVKQLGSGGTGEVHLFYEELTDKKYAIKKFNPLPQNDDDYSFDRFVQEIKILVDLNHKNIVRIYTYYLYPSLKLGYIQMEYIEGDTIDKYLSNNPDEFNNVFRMAIDAFAYLEEKGIVHRDIRFNNFLISCGELKIIDFGFGKKINKNVDNADSVLLNYPVSLFPEELSFNGLTYDTITEIYFLGCLFKKIENGKSTLFSDVIDKMCEPHRKNRFQSFEKIKECLDNNSYLISFTDKQKKIYLNFADAFLSTISCFIDNPVFETDSKIIIQKISDVYSEYSIEENILDNSKLIDTFISQGRYRYFTKHLLPVSALKDFCLLLNEVDLRKQDIIINSLKNRLKSVKIEKEDDLPF